MSPLIRSVGLRRGGTFAPPVQDFTPADLSDLALWLDAADADSLTLASGAVLQWNDKSGNGRHFSQSTSNFRPTYVENAYNGLPTIRFDGSNDRLQLGSNSLLRNVSAVTCYVVALTTSDGGQVAFWVNVVTGARMALFKASADQTVTFNYRQQDGGSQTTFSSGTTWTKDALLCVGGSLDLTAATRAIRVNGTVVAQDTDLGTSGQFSNTNANSAVIGMTTSGSAPWAGDICEVILVHRALTPTEVIKLEAYLLQKWGIT